MFWTPLLALITLQLFLCQTVRMEQLFFLPSEITALEGSCLVIPCRFKASLHLWDRSVAFTWCLWMFYGSGFDECLVIYNKKDSTQVAPRYKGRTLLVGDLKYRNCTLQINNVTREDANRYHPTSEYLVDSSLSVTVSDTPVRPTVTDPRTMTEGVPVAITCSVEHTCPAHPPSMAWDKIKRNFSTYHQELTDGMWRTVSVLNYTPAAEHHMKRIVCSATYPSGKSASSSITLSIRYSPKGVHAVLAKDPEEGHLMELSCVVKSSNPRETHFTWYKNNNVIEKQEGKTLNIERTAIDDAGNYCCVAHNVMGSSSSTVISVTVKHSPKGVRAVLAKDPEEGHLMELSCVVKSSNPRETHFSWYKNNKVIDKQEGKALKIERTAMDDAGDYRCVAHNVMGSSSSTTISVNVKHGGLWTSASSIPTNVVITVGVSVAVLAAVAIGAFVLTKRYLNNKKKKKNVNISTQLTQFQHHDEINDAISSNDMKTQGQNLYENVENTYMALDGTQTTSEYEEI